MEVPPLALTHVEDLEEEAGHVQQGSRASALYHHRGESSGLEVPPLVHAHVADLEEEAGHSRQ